MKIKYAAICDTVLQDIQNRWSLIGIYTGDVLVTSFPTRIRFALYLEMSEPVPGPIHLDVSLGERLMAKIDVEITHDPNNDSTIGVIAIPGIDIAIDSPSDLIVRWSTEKSKKALIKKSILVGDVRQ